MSKFSANKSACKFGCPFNRTGTHILCKHPDAIECHISQVEKESAGVPEWSANQLLEQSMRLLNEVANSFTGENGKDHEIRQLQARVQELEEKLIAIETIIQK